MPRIEDLARATADKLAEAAAQCAYKIFCDKQFRALACFDQLDQTEQDRIFNELLVSALLLIMLTFEAPDLDVPSDHHEYLKHVAEDIPRAHIRALRKLGVEQEHLDIWDKLIRMRYEEYQQSRLHIRAAAMELEELERELDADGLDRIALMLPVEVIAIGCHKHVCRSQTDGRDELFKVQLRAFAKFFIHIRLLTQGRRVTWWMQLLLLYIRLRRRIAAAWHRATGRSSQSPQH